MTLFAFGLKEPSVRLVGIILVICAGVLLASLGEADFHLPGFIIQVRGLCQTWLTPQCTAIAVEATRLALIQTLLQGSNFTPLTSLYSFAPVCFGTLALLIVPVEGLEALRGFPDPPPGARYDGPVLWVSGATSTYVMDADRPRMEELFPRVRLLRVKGAGHWVHSEQPEVFADSLDRFCAHVEG